MCYIKTLYYQEFEDKRGGKGGGRTCFLKYYRLPVYRYYYTRVDTPSTPLSLKQARH